MGNSQMAQSSKTHNTYGSADFLYVDDLCLISTSAVEPQSMLNECLCQTWSEKARVHINAQK